jgi:hypothetical protein
VPLRIAGNRPIIDATGYVRYAIRPFAHPGTWRNRTMQALYPKHWGLPSLALALGLAGCDGAAPPGQEGPPPSNVYLDALQQAEAARDSADQSQSQEQQIDALLGRGNGQ